MMLLLLKRLFLFSRNAMRLLLPYNFKSNEKGIGKLSHFQKSLCTDFEKDRTQKVIEHIAAFFFLSAY